jgi:hypothetical protein
MENISLPGTHTCAVMYAKTYVHVHVYMYTYMLHV